MPYFDFHYHSTKKHNGIYNLYPEDLISDNALFSIGLHPYKIDIENWKRDFDKVVEFSKKENCFAIGECGLDKLVPSPLEFQEKIFIEHIDLANSLSKPIIIHCVKSYNEIIKLKKYAKTAWVIHGFNRNQNIANELKDAGFYLSFGKTLFSNVSLQNVFKNWDLNKIFLETDDSDINIEELYQKAALLKDISVNVLQNQILNNLKEITL